MDGGVLRRAASAVVAAASVLVFCAVTFAPQTARATVTNKALIVHNSGTGNAAVPDIISGLTATGRFSQIDDLDLSAYNSPQRNIAAGDFNGYTSVLVFSDYGWADAATLGDVMADFIDAGGRVVEMPFSHAGCTGNFSPKGRYASGGYAALVVAAPDCVGGYPFEGFNPGSADLRTMTKVAPLSPLLTGVTTFDCGGYCDHARFGLNAGAELIAEYAADQFPLMAAKRSAVSHGASVVLNFFPASTRVNANFWDATTDGFTLIANALDANLWPAAVPTTSTTTTTTTTTTTSVPATTTTVRVTSTTATPTTTATAGSGTATTMTGTVNSSPQARRSAAAPAAASGIPSAGLAVIRMLIAALAVLVCGRLIQSIQRRRTARLR